ncbi:MAG: Transcriptional regulator, IclR family [uncultured Thermomicrobiales bacterium]|uniref:Transcriptional regulator, IclR family n=1 Tax=uncultured Thermomicrobiales bacterium TaxID=1645740 RepID=A0A6J4U164_9BACT|nr:MAG: Transcriptional regulator, IclR family [uncultured Thermomicrobiales bacterium]
MSRGRVASEANGRATPDYHVPALEKGLDILECLATGGVPLSQAQLARALDRGASELFRTLSTLERRGYIQRDPVSGAYSLTLRLYELGHAHSPYEALLRAAERPMRELADELRQSCHLSVLRHGALVVLHQEESPERVRLSIEIGSAVPALQTASGRLMLAFLDDERRGRALAGEGGHAEVSNAASAALVERLAAIRNEGYETARSETIEGVSDLSVLVGAPGGRVQAALTIAALPRDHAEFVGRALPPLRGCAAKITATAGLAPDVET